MKGQKIKELYFGGDYNPDQWDEATIRQDMEYFKKCHINYVALPVFSWAKLEPQEGVYNFEWLGKILDILRFLEANLAEDISIDDLAAQFFISKYHMMRRFREETGTSIHNYLSDKRLLAARDLIQSGLSATDACFRCGFRSYSAFSRAYGKLFGATPTGRIVQTLHADDFDE